MNLYTAAFTLFLIMNPLGNIPVFINTLKHVKPKRQLYIIIREALFALAILLVFLLAGHPILRGLQVSESALSVAGGIILFIIAIRLIFPTATITDRKPKGEPFLVPLAIPLFAGPATMAMLMLMSSQQTDHLGKTFIALLIAWFASSSVLLASTSLSKFLGERGLIAIERLMGMLLTTISVQMLLSGIATFFHAI